MSVRSASPEIWAVGVDDTDMPGIAGTGRLARQIAREISEEGLGISEGVTRHQLFEGAGVPKTSRNSAAGIAFRQVEDAGDLFAAVCGIVTRHAVEGSDPGVAMMVTPPSSKELGYAHRAQGGLVAQPEARRLAQASGMRLIGLGGTEGGVIGALCAAVLRADGNDGRFVGLPGIRDVSGRISVDELLERTGIERVAGEDDEPLSGSSILDVGDWVRPRLVKGHPVLVARRDQEEWVNADSRPK
jgi:hypothetical protein